MTYLPLKRDREEEIRENLSTMANYLVHDSFDPRKAASPGLLECRTCNRRFTSFQALGGHRASHKRRGLIMGRDLNKHQPPRSTAKSKSHECSICGLEFAVGQALGGHMRRHRAVISKKHLSDPSRRVEVAKKTNDHEIRVFGVDLNLTPLENDLDFNLVDLCL